MSFVRSGALAAWTRAWLAGQVSLDEAVDATTTDDAPHRVCGLAGSELADAPLRDVLVAWRRAGVEPRLVLPAPGDVRGLPGPAAFRVAALEAGEAVVTPGLGLVPEVTDFTPSSAPPQVRWQAYAVEDPPRDELWLREAQHELTAAIRESASALAAAGVAGTRAELAALLGDARRAGDEVNVPRSHPQAAVALLSQAERLQAVLDLVAVDPFGGAVDQYGVAARDGALRPLAIAVRRARQAAYNAA